MEANESLQVGQDVTDHGAQQRDSVSTLESLPLHDGNEEGEHQNATPYPQSQTVEQRGRGRPRKIQDALAPAAKSHADSKRHQPARESKPAPGSMNETHHEVNQRELEKKERSAAKDRFVVLVQNLTTLLNIKSDAMTKRKSQFSVEDLGNERVAQSLLGFLDQVERCLVRELCSDEEAGEIMAVLLRRRNLGNAKEDAQKVVEGVAHIALMAHDKSIRRAMYAVLVEKLKATKARLCVGAVLTDVQRTNFDASTIEERVNISDHEVRALRHFFRLLESGESPEERKRYAARVSEGRVYGAINFIISRMEGDICAGVTRTASYECNTLGRQAFLERTENISTLFVDYKRSCSEKMDLNASAEHKPVGVKLFSGLVKALTRRKESVSCLPEQTARGLSAFAILEEYLDFLIEVSESFHSEDQHCHEFFDLSFLPKELQKRLSGVVAHFKTRRFEQHIGRCRFAGAVVECDGDYLHCPLRTMGETCLKNHAFTCSDCAWVILIGPQVKAAGQAVLNSLRRKYPGHYDWTNDPADNASSKKKKKPKDVEPDYMPALLGIIATGQGSSRQALIDTFRTKCPLSKASNHQLAKRIAQLGVQDQGIWKLTDAGIAEQQGLQSPPTTSAANTATQVVPTEITGEMAIARKICDGMTATPICGDMIEVLFGSSIRAMIQRRQWEVALLETRDDVACVEMDFAMKTLQQQKEASQSSFFGRSGIDMISALVTTTAGASVHKHFVDSVLSTSEHTVENFIAILESKVRAVSDRGGKYIHFRTDGASNFKSTLLIPYIVNANRIGWNCGAFVGSFTFWESGDGKGAVDVHFSYKNHKVKQWVDAGNDVLAPKDLAMALSGGFKPESCVRNSTVRFVLTAKISSSSKAVFVSPIPVRSLHCLEFLNVPENAPDDSIVCYVQSSWVSPKSAIKKKEVDSFLQQHEAFASVVQSTVEHEVVSAIDEPTIIGPRKQRVQHNQMSAQGALVVECLVSSLADHTANQVAFQQLDGILDPPSAIEQQLLEGLKNSKSLRYAMKSRDSRPPMPAWATKDLDDMFVSSLLEQKVSAEEAFTRIIAKKGFLVRATVDLSRVKQRFSGLAKKARLKGKHTTLAADTDDNPDDELDAVIEVMPDEAAVDIEQGVAEDEVEVLESLESFGGPPPLPSGALFFDLYS